MTELIGSIFLLAGGSLMLIGAIGVIRMPDLFTRMQATSKTATLGVGCMLVGVSFYFGDLSIITRSLAVVLFAFLTTPVGAQMIARAAYFSGVQMWETRVNQLQGMYDPRTHELASYPLDRRPPVPAPPPPAPPDA